MLLLAMVVAGHSDSFLVLPKQKLVSQNQTAETNSGQLPFELSCPGLR